VIKTKYYTTATNDSATASEAAELAQQHGITMADGGFVVLGVPVGTDAFIRDHVGEQVDAILQQLPAIQQLVRDPEQSKTGTLQQIFNLVRLCIPSQFTYTLRTVPPSLVRAAAVKLDNGVANFIAQLLGFREADDSDAAAAQRRRILLPIDKGGMGIMSSARASYAGYVAAWAQAAPVIKTLCPQLVDAVQGVSDRPDDMPRHLRALHDTLLRFGKGNDTLVHIESMADFTLHNMFDEPLPTAGLQHKITEALAQRELDEIKASLDTRNTADKQAMMILNSVVHKSSGAWVTANPTSYYTKMSDQNFRDSAQLRVGMQQRDEPGACAKCGSATAMDIYHLHVQRCRGKDNAQVGNLTERHTDIRDVLKTIISKYLPKYKSIKEPLVTDPRWKWPTVGNVSNSMRRGDLIVWTTEEGGAPEPVLIDITCTGLNPAGPAEPLANADKATAAKINKYKSAFKIPDNQLIIFSVEATGAINKAGVDWLKSIIKHQFTTRRGNNYITDWKQYSKLVRLAFEWIAVAVQKGVGTQVASYRHAAARALQPGSAAE
jgi:hypothetical protein